MIIDEELIKQNFGNQEIFEEKRLKGDNDNFLCEIILEDSVKKIQCICKSKQITAQQNKNKTFNF